MIVLKEEIDKSTFVVEILTTLPTTDRGSRQKKWVRMPKSSKFNKVDLVDTGLMPGHKASLDKFLETDHADYSL